MTSYEPDIEAEQRLLGALIADPDATDDVLVDLRPADFYRHDHEVIFSAILELRARGDVPDATALRKHLRDQLRGAIDVRYISHLCSCRFTDHAADDRSVGTYSRIVRDAAVERQMLIVAEQIAGLARSVVLTSTGKIERAQSLTMGLTRSIPGARPADAGEIAASLLEAFDNL